jgi:hypothetical protein
VSLGAARRFVFRETSNHACRWAYQVQNGMHHAWRHPSDRVAPLLWLSRSGMEMWFGWQGQRRSDCSMRS